MIVAFDLDGTLIDSTKRHYYLMEELLKNYKIEIPFNFRKEFMDYKAKGYSGLSYLINCLNIETNIAVTINNDWKKHIEDDLWLNTDVLFYDALFTCKTLEKLGVDLFFLSNRNNKNGAKNELLRLGLSDFPDNLFLISCHDTYKKADILSSLKELDSHCIMIGDTEVDYQAAIEAETDYYMLNRGFRCKHFWDVMNVRSYNSLLPILKRIDAYHFSGEIH
ncbi:Phosphoglycolate phosphatase, HAD superfamily [Succiniclasticum ruminis]|uniref:Phosphoglycolate phosphatase, HAD superfamily n=1 Tax=Succiniclasticum ruminis TaxID=40841 RepID=A0A1G6HMT1_9FIRM|nr:HAD family hydrolase [Succiniclasticum ruminis]SDB95428.1 Phosphoglycolate phosphatase, HAD superfamily [Succiniclasticum ruminis]